MVRHRLLLLVLRACAHQYTLTHTHCPAKNAGPCYVCLPGTYKTAPGSAPCLACALGHYSAVSGATRSCAPCAAGSSARVIGSVACEQCQADTAAPSGEGWCEPCRDHTYSTTGAPACSECHAFAISPAHMTNNRSCYCNAGYSGVEGGKCARQACIGTPCAAHIAAVHTDGARVCAETCIACAAGSYRLNTGCVACAPGSSSLEASATVLDCHCTDGFAPVVHAVGPDVRQGRACAAAFASARFACWTGTAWHVLPEPGPPALSASSCEPAPAHVCALRVADSPHRFVLAAPATANASYCLTPQNQTDVPLLLGAHDCVFQAPLHIVFRQRACRRPFCADQAHAKCITCPPTTLQV